MVLVLVKNRIYNASVRGKTLVGLLGTSSSQTNRRILRDLTLCLEPPTLRNLATQTSLLTAQSSSACYSYFTACLVSYFGRGTRARMDRAFAGAESLVSLSGPYHRRGWKGHRFARVLHPLCEMCYRCGYGEKRGAQRPHRRRPCFTTSQRRYSSPRRAPALP